LLPARVTVEENCEKFHVVVEPLVDDELELLLEELDEEELLELLDELEEELLELLLEEPLSDTEPEVDTLRVAPQ
jgi:Mg/Co/Ni transporter MgtE